jgi:hypothetical protein
MKQYKDMFSTRRPGKGRWAVGELVGDKYRRRGSQVPRADGEDTMEKGGGSA